MYIYKASKPGNPVMGPCTIKKEMFNKINSYFVSEPYLTFCLQVYMQTDSST